MSKKLSLITLICITSFIAGCATTGGPSSSAAKALCGITMATGGAGIGTVIKNDPAATAGGILVGSLVGYFLCGDDEEPVKVAEKPMAEPMPPADSDGDGVTDDKDQCPNTPRGTAVNSVGCALDSDGDGVVDGSDDCPNTPRGQSVNDRGCHVIFSLEGVNFAYDSAVLTSAATTKLNAAVAMLKANAGIKIRIEGHTDSRGSDAYNMSLSDRRAASVLSFLTSNGINASRLTSVGLGESSPVASNETDAGRAQNRRVDFRVQN